MREKGRLRPRGESDPASGYSYQDESRVESLRAKPGGAPSTPHAEPANDVAPKQSRVASKTMVGGFGIPVAAARASEPSSKESWPAMPSVPPELEGAADGAQREPERAGDDALENMPTDPPKSAQLGGAIWQAVPSVMSSAPPSEQAAPPSDAQKAQEDIAALVQESAGRVSVAQVPLFSESMRARISKHQAQYGDVRLAKLDPLFERSAWEQVVKELGDERDVTAQIALLRIIAQREILPEKDKRAAQLTRDAIAALAEILQVPETSPIALLLAKRLLRRNRAAGAVAPSKGLSAGVLVGGLAIGAGVGWLITKIFL